MLCLLSSLHGAVDARGFGAFSAAFLVFTAMIGFERSLA